jgi:hypothetical protein
MALFFDQEWFDAKLTEVSRTRDDVAAALRLTRAEVEEIWKDQRELSPQDVAALAALLGEVPAAVANKAGISTPVPAAPAGGEAAVLAKLAAMEERLVRMERSIADLQSLILATRPFE